MVLKKARPVAEGPLEAAELPRPEPGHGEALVRVAFCGVCHTDLHTVEGELVPKKLPIVPGHQAVGRVERLGEGCSRLREGQRVGVAWLHETCGECSYCERGLENLCSKARFTGLHTDGGYAQYLKVPEAFAYPLPEAFSDREAAPLLCAGIIGYRALRLSGVAEGGRLGLYGFGASAHLTIQVALHKGCEVYVFSRTAEHRKLALELGASWVGEAQDSPPKKLHGSIVFAPAGWIVPEALRVTDRGGTVALAGIHMSPIPSLEYHSHLYHERVLRSVANSTRGDGEEFLKVAADISIRAETTLYPLGEANRALQDLKAGEISGAAVLKVP